MPCGHRQNCCKMAVVSEQIIHLKSILNKKKQNTNACIIVLRIERHQQSKSKATYASSKSKLIYIFRSFTSPNFIKDFAIVVFPNYFSLYSSFITRLIFFLCLPNQTKSGNQSINIHTYIFSVFCTSMASS